jgi:hypothetical protein
MQHKLKIKLKRNKQKNNTRGIEFGDQKTQQWLTSILSKIFSSILLTQPLKIISLAIFFACFLVENQMMINKQLN